MGNIYFETEGSYSNGLSMNSAARLENIDTSRLISGKSFGVGIVDGQVSMQAKRAASLNEVSGRYDISLSQTKALEMPVLDKLPQMVKLPKMGANPRGEDGGYLFGRISGGVIHLEEMALFQSNIQMLMNGTSTLDGRIAIDVSASTDQSGPIDDLIALADSPLMLAAPAPIALLAKANDALKNRVVHLHVSGTADRPTICLQPGKQLSQEAVKFFVKNSLGTRVADLSTSQATRRRR